MNKEMKCPFCNHTEWHIAIIERVSPLPDQYKVLCGRCAGMGPISETQEQAIERYSTRPEEERLQGILDDLEDEVREANRQ